MQTPDVTTSAFAVVPPAVDDIRKVCVIGAGTMGVGIAAHLANVGFEVTLFDLNRQALEDGFAKARAAKPPHFMADWVPNSITLSTLDEGMGAIRDADWIIEAIVEREDAKRELYSRIEREIGPQALLSSNTSGISIEGLASALTPATAPKFVGTHFFNPPRYLPLVELIPHGGTAPEYLDLYKSLLEDKVGERVIFAKDTPGFIANRIGMFALYHAIHCAERLGLSVEETDELTGEFMGRSKSGTFRLADIIGLDVMSLITTDLRRRLPNDPAAPTLKPSRSMEYLIGKGWIGEKSGHGFTRREAKELLVLDLQTYAYRQRRETRIALVESLKSLPLAERLRAGMNDRSPYGEFLRSYLPGIIRYAATVRNEISHSVEDVDGVMKWGFGWSHGPFELADLLNANGTSYYKEGQQLSADGKGYVPRDRSRSAKRASDYKLTAETSALEARDFDGRVGLGIKTKQGTITPELIGDLTEALEAGDGPFLLYSTAKNFSVGYDLNVFLDLITSGDLEGVEARLDELQKLGSLIDSKPVIAAVHGYCLGAGYELARSCRAIIADANAKIGLPEARVGLIPGGRGTALMRLRSQLSNATMIATIVALAKGQVAENALQARQMNYLSAGDEIVFHPDRLFATAFALPVSSTPPSHEWKGLVGPIVGQADNALRGARGAGEITEYDERIGEKLKNIMTKTVSFDEALVAERREFLDLCRKAPTLARIRHMLDTGKPLRN